MPAQSLEVIACWEPRKSDIEALWRNHALDLDEFGRVATTQIVGIAPERVDYAPRVMDAEIEGEPHSSRFFFWVREALTIEEWTAVFVYTGTQLHLFCPRERWVFDDDAPDFRVWHEACAGKGAR